MRRLAFAFLIAACAVAATPAGAAFTPSSGIDGVVRNTTCPGPCVDPPPPAPLYTGDGLIVKIRDRATHDVVARLHPKDGRFHADVGPGSYHVRALIRAGGSPSQCWSGSSRNVGIVDRGARVRLTVHNDCIV